MILGRKQGKQNIDEILENVRSRYQVLITAKGYPSSLMQAFDDRYYTSLKAKIDIRHFLEAEKVALDELESRNSSSDEEDDENGNEDAEETFLNRVTRELRERIEGYPSAVLPAEASYDMEKLAGMLIQFGQQSWPVIEQIVRRVYPVSRPEMRISLETLIFEHCIPGNMGLPRFFERYIQELNRGVEEDIEKEEKRCLTGAARFLNTMKAEVFKLRSQVQDKETAKTLGDIETYILAALDNFRMKDLRFF